MIMKTTVKLKDIASYSKGSQINGNNLIENGTYEYLNGGINPSGKWNEYNVDGNTITISEGGNSCGYVNYMINPFWCGAHCYYLYDLKCPSEYLYYALKGNQSSIMKLRSGACMPNIKKKDLGEFVLSIDLDKNEQDRVIAIFNCLSSIITHRRTQLEKLDLLVKARFVEMFGTYPANEYDWEIGTIRDLVTEVRYGSSRKASDNNSGKYPYLRMNNITYSGELDLSDTKTIDMPDKELPKCTVRKGDVLFNRTNSKELVGKTCVYNRDEKMVLAGFIIRIRLNEKMLPDVLSSFLNTDFSKKMLLEMCKTAIGQANINAQEMQNIGIYIPPIELQEKFVTFKRQVDKSKATIQKALDEAQLLFDSLMQEYFG